MKPNPEAPIDQIIRHLALAAGIAQRRRMGMTLRRLLGNSLHAAFNYAEGLRAKGKK